MSASAVATPLNLHDVDAPIRFCQHVLADSLRRIGTHHITDTDREDALSYLLVDLCKLAGRYDPTIGGSFSTFAYRVLMPNRVRSWYRQQFGDARYGNNQREQSVGDTDAFDGACVDVQDLASLIAEVDHDRLSSRARNTLTVIVPLMVEEGLNAEEVADRLAKDRRQVTRDLDRLREEWLR